MCAEKRPTTSSQFAGTCRISYGATRLSGFYLRTAKIARSTNPGDGILNNCERGNEFANPPVWIIERTRNKESFLMNRLRIATAMLGLLAPCFAPPLRADERNKETRVTTRQPLQVQDTVLPPG